MRLPSKAVHAADGKAARAAPVATLFESGAAKLAGRFAELEAKLAGFAGAGAMKGRALARPGRRDGLGLWELLLAPQRGSRR